MTQNAVPGMVKLVPASNLTGPRPFQHPGEPAHLEVPWELLFELKLKIYVKIIYSEHFLFFEIFWLFMIFGTLFSRKCPFLGNFDKSLFLLPSSTHMDKKCHKNNSKLNLEPLLVICVDDGGKNRFLSNLPKNGHFPLNKVSKITNIQKISKNRKWSEYMIFT